MQHYDCIVVGTGGVGSAALYQLAQRGVRALGIDRFPPGHDRGSSHGETRIIRLAYLEHPSYVPLLQRAFVLWDELEQRTGQQLYRETGFLQIGPTDGPTVQGALTSSREHGLTVEKLSSQEVESRYTGFRVPNTMSAVLDPRAGFLLVEPCVMAYADEAVKLSAEIRTGESVLSWQSDGSGFVVETKQQRYSAQHLILTAGAWAADFLKGLNISLEVRRKSLFWYETPDEAYSVDAGCPTFFYELPYGCFYGFPKKDKFGLKIAEHTGGQPVADPLNLDQSIDPEDQRRIADVLSEYMPGVTQTCSKHAACMYTMSPDEHFIIDAHPEHEKVVYAAGLSGHGFKFVNVLAEALVELTLKGKTDLPIDFLSAKRFSQSNAA